MALRPHTALGNLTPAAYKANQLEQLRLAASAPQKLVQKTGAGAERPMAPRLLAFTVAKASSTLAVSTPLRVRHGH